MVVFLQSQRIKIEDTIVRQVLKISFTTNLDFFRTFWGRLVLMFSTFL